MTTAVEAWDVWAARRRVVRRRQVVAVEDYEGPGDPEPLWVHPDGCLTPVGDGSRMYPICEHQQRARFVGYRGDGYVLEAGPGCSATEESEMDDEIYYQDVVDWVETNRPDLDPQAVWVKVENGAATLAEAVAKVDQQPG